MIQKYLVLIPLKKTGSKTHDITYKFVKMFSNWLVSPVTHTTNTIIATRIFLKVSNHNYPLIQ